MYLYNADTYCEHDPFWQLVQASYPPHELVALVLWANAQAELVIRMRARQGLGPLEACRHAG